jgi:hypothetical protein
VAHLEAGLAKMPVLVAEESRSLAQPEAGLVLVPVLEAGQRGYVAHLEAGLAKVPTVQYTCGQEEWKYGLT